MGQDQREKFLRVFDSLSAADKAAVSSFAEFLLSRSDSAAAVTGPVSAVAVEVPDPEPIPRPQGEKVVAAVKRLSKTYFMLDKSKMLGVTSDLVTQHVLQGREACEVIDDLEQVFESHYRQLKQADAD